ncbi:SDR family NAD(P)-dependent oxidoreductase [Alteribacillus sp. HJP-4]|uniref:SDR family NAD(P)-dependent oxidoreductase n=1 Tax=Alteribacillus sp. HJP-4 TaxID=2775394 RepID=UPI0035CD2F86
MAKKILITGASGGIGKAVAYRAASEGYQLILTARRKEKLEELKFDLEKQGASVNVIPSDISSSAGAEALMEEVYQDEGKIDVLINNAGIGYFETIEAMESKKAVKMMEINVLAIFYLTKAALPKMKSQKNGHIINIGSLAGKVATPKASIYAASKHAVIGFSNALRMEVKPFGIHVSVVNTGPVRTEFFNKADPGGTYEKSVEKFIIEPDKLAERILLLIEKPKRELNLPWWMNLLAKMYLLFPSFIERSGHKQLNKK